ncbi:hypothetical protein JNK13_10075 [bacterium]|nr:hypothetical protein [bacterium]
MQNLLFDNFFVLFCLSGPDAERYLHNRTTQNIKALEIEQSREALITTPQGKLQGKCLIFRKAKDQFLILADISPSSPAELFLQALLQFKVADRFEVIKMSLAEVNLVELGLNRDLFAASSKTEFHLCRIKAKQPHYGIDLDEHVSAVELLDERALCPYISGNKGCYTGQEVIEKASAIGKAPRVFKLIKASSCEVGVEILTQNNEVAGAITSAAQDPISGESFGLALIRSRQLGQSLTVNGTPVTLLS